MADESKVNNDPSKTQDRNGGDDLSRNIFRIDLEKLPDFKKLNVLQAFGARLALAAIQIAVSNGSLHVNRLGHIADFGAGTGGPTFALTEVSKVIGGEVVAIENDPNLAGEIVKSGILPQEQVRVADGLSYLNKAKENEGKGYDLITAFMLGPDLSGKLFRDLAHVSSRGLSEGGSLLITSDLGTFSIARDICKSSGIQFNFINGISEGKVVVPNTLIIPKVSCERIR